MEDVSSGENLCIKINGRPIAWKKSGCFLFPQLSEVLRTYLVTASLLSSSPHAKAHENNCWKGQGHSREHKAG